MGDECFNNLSIKHFITINTFLCSLGHIGLDRSTELHENSYFILLNEHDSVQLCPFTAPESSNNIVDKNIYYPTYYMQSYEVF